MIRLKIKNIVVFGMGFIIKIMNKRSKEKRLNDNCHLVDEDDLTGIECTFKDIKRTNESIREELRHLRDVNDIREKANDIRYYTLLAVITVSSILLSILKVLF